MSVRAGDRYMQMSEPAWQTRVGLHVRFTPVPVPQHICPEAPQAIQLVAVPVAPVAQRNPAEQVSAAPPVPGQQA
ncbi:MAG: hypothetical protein ABUL77_03450 [Bacteroidota bacterium]